MIGASIERFAIVTQARSGSSIRGRGGGLLVEKVQVNKVVVDLTMHIVT